MDLPEAVNVLYLRVYVSIQQALNAVLSSPRVIMVQSKVNKKGAKKREVCGRSTTCGPPTAEK